MTFRAAPLVALALAFGAGLPAPGSVAAEARIGIGAPLSGAEAVYGDEVKLGVTQAIADIDAAGGFAGRQAGAVPRDDGGDPKKGVEVAKSFVADKIGIVIGHFSSAVTVPASSVYADAGMLEITPSALAPLVTERGIATLFRTCGREDQQAEAAARFLLARRIARVAIVHDRTSTGKNLADSVRRRLADAGVRDVFYGSVEKGSREVSGLAGRIKASGAQIVFYGGGAAEIGTLARQMRESGVRATMMGGTAMASDEFATAAGAAADGALTVFPQDPRTRPAAADLLRRLQAKGLDPGAYVFYAYAAVQVVAQAADATGTLEPARLAAAMHDGRTFKTVLGDLSFDAKGDPTVSDFTVWVWHKGASGRMAFDEQARS